MKQPSLFSTDLLFRLILSLLCVRVHLDLIILAGVGAAYGAYSISVDTILFLLSINHPHTLEYTYLLGGLTTLSILAIYAFTKSRMPLQIPVLYRVILKRVEKDDRVREMTGGQLVVGTGKRVLSEGQGPVAAAVTTPVASASGTASATEIEKTVNAESLTSPRSMGGFKIVNVLNGGPRWRAEKGVNYIGWERYWRPRQAQLSFHILTQQRPSRRNA